jgi:hypothetical protein
MMSAHRAPPCFPELSSGINVLLIKGLWGFVEQMTNNQSRRLFAICGGAALLIWPQIVSAEGALAVGTVGNIAKDGYSIGITVNKKTSKEASATALEWCRTHGSERTRPRCNVITTFHHQCAAEAYDPKAGTPGAGWAVGADKEAAEKIAMSNCAATAGAERRSFCVVASALCDTKP